MRGRDHQGGDPAISEEAFQALFEASPLPLLLTDAATGEILDANALALAACGLQSDQIRGRSVYEFGHYRDAGDRQSQLDALDRATGTGREVQLTTPAGRRLRLLAHTSRMRLAGRSCFLTAFTDVTSLGRLDEQLLAAQRMEVAGKLAGGVAHEFNNLLTVMRGHLDALTEDAPDDPALQARVAALGRAVDQATRITSGLLTFSGRNPTPAATIDLNDALTGLRSLITGTIGETIEIVWQLDAREATVRMGEAQIAQVVLNLALNAREAMPQGGRITIGTAFEPASLADGPGSGPWVCLRVADTGCGMSADVRRRAFEPFFTTKGPGRGTGLGLPICQGIAEQASGHIEVHSAEGRGTSVQVYLPWVAPRAEVALPIAPPQKPPARSGRVILLVEDEADVRMIVAEILRRAGHTVHAADGAAAAEALLDQLDAPLDLLLSDLVLPGANGVEVARRVQARHPDVPVLFISGYSEDVFSGEARVEHLLQKPFTSRELLDTIATLLSD
ncbi:MAG: ATP-binding protein [Vicinamibacterales bacterium]